VKSIGSNVVFLKFVEMSGDIPALWVWSGARDLAGFLAVTHGYPAQIIDEITLSPVKAGHSG
jgi:hypothetical protein